MRNFKQDQDHMQDRPGGVWGKEEQIFEFLLYYTEDMHGTMELIIWLIK